MKIQVIRFKSNNICTIGKMFFDGVFQCYTLEDAYHESKIFGSTRIPSGTYRLDLRTSPKFSPKYGHKMIWVKDVPEYEYILIHKGNTAKDTYGCILVGMEQGENQIINSKDAYDLIYPKISSEINSGNSVYLTMVDFDL